MKKIARYSLVSFAIIILILGVLYTFNSSAKYLMEDVVYFVKSNEWYVSLRYSINIENSTKSGKDYAFWGKDKKTDKLKYVLYIYHKGNYLVDGNDGITLEEAKKLAIQNGVGPFYISLVVSNLFNENKNIIDYMYWFADYGNGSSQYIRFSDGRVERDPFK